LRRPVAPAPILRPARGRIAERRGRPAERRLLVMKAITQFTGGETVLKVKDIMVDPVFTLGMDVSVEEAAWAFTRRHIGGAPVLDDGGRLAGFLSKTDLVDPSWTDWVTRKKATVGDVMQPQVLALVADAPAMAAVHGMVGRGIHHVMVVDDDRRLVGMVTSFDIVRALARGASFEEPAQPVHPAVA
jgi:CBS-domain-containing membrane protein